MTTSNFSRPDRGQDETVEEFGSEEATQLPDHVIAERGCQRNAAEEEESMHIRQRREDEDGGEKKEEKRKGRRQREVSLETSRRRCRAAVSIGKPARHRENKQDQTYISVF